MHNKTYSNKHNQPLHEGLQYRDLDGLMKPTIHVDEFSSKMGDDADIIVLSFFVRDKKAARDLMSWFEKGYDFVLDSDTSPGEIKPNRYLVYLEMRRRNAAPGQVQELLNDLNTLTEFEPEDWQVRYNDQEWPWNPETFAQRVPMTPRDYEVAYKDVEKDLNEWRVAAGLPVVSNYDKRDRALQTIQSSAGII